MCRHTFGFDDVLEEKIAVFLVREGCQERKIISSTAFTVLSHLEPAVVLQYNKTLIKTFDTMMRTI